MKKNIQTLITTLFLLFNVNFALADTHLEKVEATQNLKTIEVSLKGMVCDSCARDIEKTFMAIPGISKAQSSFAKKNVVLGVQDNFNIDDELINKTIEDLGYTVTSIKR